jgi:hypothetical protein
MRRDPQELKLWELLLIGVFDVFEVREIRFKGAYKTKQGFGLVKNLGGSEILSKLRQLLDKTLEVQRSKGYRWFRFDSHLNS